MSGVSFNSSVDVGGLTAVRKPFFDDWNVEPFGRLQLIETLGSLGRSSRSHGIQRHLALEMGNVHIAMSSRRSVP